MIKVLLVDDEKKFAMMLSKRLALRGIDVDYSFTGEDARQMAAIKRYDVAILDVKMPGIGGIRLKKELMEFTPDTKVIFLTGHGSNTDHETGKTEKDIFLAKPLQLETLVELLHKLAE